MSMACPSISTGKGFLSGALQHIDCQAQAIGSYGYGALADPGSMVSLALTGLLTVFVAIYGARLALGHKVDGQDLVGDVIRIAIVLTLASSWPAWRVIGYDLVVHGPQEIATTVGRAANLPGSNGDLPSRLQKVDDALAALNEKGAGRPGVANGDWFQLGFARVVFLIGTIGPLALVRLAAGFLLAIAPLVAGLMLFGVTRSILVGWAKGLVTTFLAMIALSLVLSAELAMVEPWLRDVIRMRIANEQTLSAPIEILIMALVFALIAFGMIALASRIANHASTWIPAIAVRVHVDRDHVAMAHGRPAAAMNLNQQPDRTRELAASVGNSIRREERMAQRMGQAVQAASPERAGGAAASGRAESAPAPNALGSSYRRTSRRVSAAGARRDIER
jgi:type IV secretion system protein VirB6